MPWDLKIELQGQGCLPPLEVRPTVPWPQVSLIFEKTTSQIDFDGGDKLARPSSSLEELSEWKAATWHSNGGGS